LPKKFVYWSLSLWLALMSNACHAELLRIAVASNFSETMKALKPLFESQSVHKLALSIGSSGKHYAQIVNGAPYDAFFSADQRRIEQIEKAGEGIPGSRFTYATGRLVLWTPQSDLRLENGEVLRSGQFKRLALANPRLAPYGRAAMQVINSFESQWDAAPMLIQGENVAQAFQFVVSGNVELGLVALSQVLNLPESKKGNYWLPDQANYSPIIQQAIKLNAKPATDEFWMFMKSPLAAELINSKGYR